MNTKDTFHLDQDDHDLDPAEAEAIAIHEAVWLYQEGKLPADEAEEIKRLISTDPRAADSLRACEQVNAHVTSPAGQAHLRQQMEVLQKQLEQNACHGRTVTKPLSTKPTLLEKMNAEWSALCSGLKSWFSPQAALSFATEAQPIHGKAGPNEEVFYTLRPADGTRTEVSVTTRVESWSRLQVTLGEESQELVLEQVGKVWAGSATFSRPFATLEALRPNIHVQNATS